MEQQHTMRMGISAGMWDTWAHRSMIWALKEHLDNAFNKAEPTTSQFPHGQTPWNADVVKVSQTLSGRHLVIADNGRGCSMEELREGFARLGHTSKFNPQSVHNNTAISMFGTGGKMADACVSTDAVIVTKQPHSGQVLLARYGKDLSAAMGDETLQFAGSSVLLEDMPKLVRYNRHRSVKEEDGADAQCAAGRLKQQLRIDDMDLQVVDCAVKNSLPEPHPSFFMRILRLRHMLSRSYTDKVLLAQKIASNFLFPPSDQYIPYLLAQQLQIPSYYVKPYGDGEIYSPTVRIEDVRVKWENNPLLKFASKCKHSPVLSLDANAERHGPAARNGGTVARIMITYLTDSKAVGKPSDKRLFAGVTEENRPYCGVAVYCGARRICNPDQDGFYSMGGVADDYLQYAESVNAFSILHSTNKQKGNIQCQDYLGAEVMAKLKSMQSVFQAGDSTVLAFKGAHMAVVVTPGVLSLTEDKTQFRSDEGHARNLMVDALHKGLDWMLENPPKPLEDRLMSYRVHMTSGSSRQQSSRQQKRRRSATESSGPSDTDSDSSHSSKRPAVRATTSAPAPRTVRATTRAPPPAPAPRTVRATTRAPPPAPAPAPTPAPKLTRITTVQRTVKQETATTSARAAAPAYKTTLETALKMLKRQVANHGQDPTQAIGNMMMYMRKECLEADVSFSKCPFE